MNVHSRIKLANHVIGTKRIEREREEGVGIKDEPQTEKIAL